MSDSSVQSLGAHSVATPEIRKSHLSHSQRQLVELLSRVHFGRIESLHVRNGQPIFAPHPRVIRTLKMKGQNAPRDVMSSDNFVLKAEVAELLEHLRQLGDGTVHRIEVAHGLPLLAEVQGTIAA